MDNLRHFSGNSEDELWPQIEADLATDPDLMEYSALLSQNGRDVSLVIDIDPGGGFEGGSETTIFTGNFHNRDRFTFALHHEGFLDEIGKFLGMQDLETGFPTFDAGIVVKSSDPDRIRLLLTDPALRGALLELGDFTFSIALPHGEETAENPSKLELVLNEGVTDSPGLRRLYSAFYGALVALEQYTAAEEAA